MADVPHETYPVNLVVAGRACLVVGGGAVAARKAAGLAAAGARVHVVAPQVGDAVRALADVTWDERPYRAREAAAYRLVIAATDDPTVNRAVHADADAAGVWVNVADDPAHCSFILPSVLRRGPLSVAVSTSGRSPAVARWLAARLGEEIGPEYEVLLELVGSARAELQAQGRTTESADWQSALDSEMLELIRTGRVATARERLQACLSSSSG